MKQFRYGLFVLTLAAIGAGAGAAARANPDFATLIASIPSELPASIPAIALPDANSEPPAALLEAELAAAEAQEALVERTRAERAITEAERDEREAPGQSPWRPVAEEDVTSDPLAQAGAPERPAVIPTDAPAIDDPRGEASTRSPETSNETALAEINAIRQDMLELLSRLAVIEARLAAGTYAAPDTNEPSAALPSTQSEFETETSGLDTGEAEAIAPSQPETAAPPNEPEVAESSDPTDISAAPSLQVGSQTISLPGDVLFDFDRSDIRPEAAQLLAEVAQSIQRDYRSGRIRVIGHTDDVGEDDYNMTLSLKRATAVKGYLTELMADNSTSYRWTAVGNGANAPVSDNSTSAGRQLNRRVDLVIAP